MWDLPGPGLEPVSPALAGGFLTTAPPGKPHKLFVFLVGSIRSVSYGKTGFTYEKEILSNYKDYQVYKVRNVFPKYL